MSAKVPSYVAKAQAYLQRQRVRETPYLATMARIARELRRIEGASGAVPGPALTAIGQAAETLERAIEHDGIGVKLAHYDDATPPLFPEAE